MISPGYPNEMPLFTLGLDAVGANVIGLGDVPEGALPRNVRRCLAAYVHVPSLWHEEDVVAQVLAMSRKVRIDRVECLWEPGILLAGRLRDALGVPGLGAAASLPFRDKVRMKEVLDRAGIRTPRNRRATSATELREAAEVIGFPVIAKPVAGAGSADTHRLETKAELESVLSKLRHVPELSVEEFIDGEEYTFDAICHDGTMLYHNVAHYRPRPLVARTVQWISPQTIARRELETDELRGGIEMGKRVLDAMGFRTGFTHMEWFRKSDGEVVFGEIAARPPGARTVDLMNFASDTDLFVGWAEAVCHGRLSQPLARKYNAAVIFKRAQGEGRIQRIEGLERLMARFAPFVASVDLLPVGAPRRNWKQTLLSDGSLVVRHPDLATCEEIADAVGTDIRIYAG